MKLLTTILLTLALAACGSDAPTSGTLPCDVTATCHVSSTPPPKPPVQTAPPVTPTDDTAAVQALLDKGGTVTLEARDYHFSAMLMISVSGTTLQGAGKATNLIFTPPPKGTAKSCKTDRAISVLCGLSFYPPRAIDGAITIGDTSMQVDDASGINPGDWLLLGDWGVLGTYTSVVDWEQVASVDGNVINFVSPTRIAINDPAPFVPYQAGAGFVRMINLTNVTVQDLAITVNAAAGSVPQYPALGVTGTVGTVFQRLTINDPVGNPFYTYYSKGTVVQNNTFTGGIASEVASTVDFSVSDNQFVGANLSLDLGAAFFSVAGNSFSAPQNIGIYTTDNVHDGAITDNTIGYVEVSGGVQDAVGIYLEGSPNLTVSGNSLAGGAGAGSQGIRTQDESSPPFAWTDSGDVLSGNTIQGFATAVVGP